VETVGTVGPNVEPAIVHVRTVWDGVPSKLKIPVLSRQNSNRFLSTKHKRLNCRRLSFNLHTYCLHERYRRSRFPF
jgi:hypothetical protein